MTFTTAHFHVTAAQFDINCTLKYALLAIVYSTLSLCLIVCVCTGVSVCVALLWVAPEVLRMVEGRHEHFSVYGTRDADVYSFAVVMQEIATGDEPYYACDLDLEGSSRTLAVCLSTLIANLTVDGSA